MDRRPSAAARQVLLLLLSLVSVCVLLLGIAGMHAGMADSSAHTGSSHVAAVDAGTDMVMVGTAAAVDVMQHGMGGMSAMDCLLLGMMCVFGAIALVLLLTLIAQPRSLLRRRLVVRARSDAAVTPRSDPPSLLVLSISRT